jgi:hypothetical protein
MVQWDVLTETTLWTMLWTRGVLSNTSVNVPHLCSILTRYKDLGKKEVNVKNPVRRGIQRHVIKVLQDTHGCESLRLENHTATEEEDASIAAGGETSYQPWVTRQYKAGAWEAEDGKSQWNGPEPKKGTVIMNKAYLWDFIKVLIGRVQKQSGSDGMYEMVSLATEFHGAMMRLSFPSAKAEKSAVGAENLMDLADDSRGMLFAQVDMAINGDMPLDAQANLEYRKRAAFYVRHLNTRKQVKMVFAAESAAQDKTRVPVWRRGLDLNTLKRHAKHEALRLENDSSGASDDDDFVAPPTKKPKKGWYYIHKPFQNTHVSQAHWLISVTIRHRQEVREKKR